MVHEDSSLVGNDVDGNVCMVHGGFLLSKVVSWLHEHRSEGCTSAAMDKAAAAGHLEMVSST